MMLIIVILICLPGLVINVEPPYTEDLAEFKDKNYNARTQLLVGCWLYVSDYLSTYSIGEINEENLHILKECMKKIKRKDAVLKITQLAQKNMEPVKPFKQILNVDDLKAEKKELTQFDKYLLTSIKKYDTDFQAIKQKGEIKDQVEEEMKRRQGFYFGIIPANTFGHVVIVASLSVTMICCCTWCKFYKTQLAKKQEKKLKMKEAKEVQLKNKNEKVKKLSKQVKKQIFEMKKQKYK